MSRAWRCNDWPEYDVGMSNEHYGMYIYENGKDVSRRAGPWKEFMQRVSDAAVKEAGRVRMAPDDPRRDNLRPEPGFKPPPPDRTCQFVHTKGAKKGRRCRQWAMRGATRCMRHGGYREVPEHPATVRRLSKIITVDARKKMRRRVIDADPKLRRIVQKALASMGIPRRPETVVIGIEALEADDGGRAWRRFCEMANKAVPSDDLRARQKKPSQS